MPSCRQPGSQQDICALCAGECLCAPSRQEEAGRRRQDRKRYENRPGRAAHTVCVCTQHPAPTITARDTPPVVWMWLSFVSVWIVSHGACSALFGNVHFGMLRVRTAGTLAVCTTFQAAGKHSG
jgi:hypothetical protein